MFKDDGTYSYVAYINDEYAAYDNGTYEIQGSKLALHSTVDNEDKEVTVKRDKVKFFEDEYTKSE